MKKAIVYLIGLAFVLSLLMAACSGTTPTPQTEEPKSVESVVTEEPKPVESVVTEQPAATEEEAVPTDSTPRKSTLKIATDFTLPDGNGNMVSLEDELQENEQVVLVFYIGVNCPRCMAQLSEIENDRARYEEKGAQVIAIAVQDELQASTSAEEVTPISPYSPTIMLSLKLTACLNPLLPGSIWVLERQHLLCS